MTERQCPLNRKLLVTCVISALASTVANAQDNDIEEVIVTGSLIRGTPTDAPSPVTIVDRSSIQQQGAAGIWDVIKNLNINADISHKK